MNSRLILAAVCLFGSLTATHRVNAASFTFDFSQGIDSAFFEEFQERDFWSVTTDTLGLVLSKPADDGSTYSIADPRSRAGLLSSFQIDGDFSLEIDYDWFNGVTTPTFSGGDHAVELYLISDANPNLEIRVSTFRNWNGQQNTSLRCFENPGVPLCGVSNLGGGVPLQGRLGFQRVGSTISVSGTDSSGSDVVFWSFSTDFSTGPMRIRLNASQSQNIDSVDFEQIDPRGPMEVAIGALRLEADTIISLPIDIEKLTNGNQADAANDADVPHIVAGNVVTWTYQVTNKGEAAFSEDEVVVTDSQASVTPVLDVSSDDGDSLLSPGETWSYTASGQALDLSSPAEVVTLVPGCDDGRPTYENTGSVTVPGGSDTDSSHYCNPSVADTMMVAAVLPTSRSVQVGIPATAFGTIINSGASDATGCGITPITAVPANFVYQTTDPATNVLTGTPNTPADIAAGASQSYVFAFTPTAEFVPTDIALAFDCTDTVPALVVPGLNTFLLSSSNTPVPDIIALAATPTGDGIVGLPADVGQNAFAVATANVGATDVITATADTGGTTPPVNLVICETNPGTGECLSSPTASVTTNVFSGTTPTFTIFVTGTGTVPFDPAGNRIFVRFRDGGGVTRGSTSVAVRTQ